MNKITKFSTNRLVIENGSLFSHIHNDILIKETPIALVYNGISHAVMMGTPADLDDFAVGFSIAENIIRSPSDIFDIEIIEQAEGIEVQLEISSRQFMALKEKRRSMSGRTGCGICGVEQLEQVQQNCKFLPKLPRLQAVDPTIFNDCLAQLEAAQSLAKQTGASHAAAFFSPKGELLAIREDVGRHVALDKLIGWYVKAQAPLGFVLVTSRASFEMVQKCLACGIEMLCAISATTEMAVNMAQEHGFTLIAFTRQNKATVYSGENRLTLTE